MTAPDRFASIAAAVLVGDEPQTDTDSPTTQRAESAVRAARLLAGLFEDVMWVGGAPPQETPARHVDAVEGPGPLGGVASALRAARTERVLVLEAGGSPPSLDLCLALLAWPEADVVAPRATRGSPLLALYRRDPALDRARRLLADGRSDPAELHDALECEILEAEDLACLDREVGARARGGAGGS